MTTAVNRSTQTTGETMATETVTSADGTKIAFDRLGSGPPLILVVGAFNTRETTAPLATALQGKCTVFNYDRRGRGESGDAHPYAIERELEDIDALIQTAGGSAAVFGYSSGATLALKAAAHGLAISKLALYDAPFVVDDSYAPLPADLPAQLATLIAAGKRGDAVELYQKLAVGIADEVIAQMRHAPFRPALDALAHTLVYDATIIGDRALPADLASTVSTPTLVIDGENSPPIMHSAAHALGETLPNAQRCTLAGQSHDIDPDITAAELEEFLAA
jgi:pimeloyl-ACP methyl ester carboxylesterase